MDKSLVASKFRNRRDRFAPHLALRELNGLSRKRMPGVVRRLYDLAESDNESISLAAINTLLKFVGLDKFVEMGIKMAAEQEGGGDEDEDDEEERRRRKRLAKRYDAEASPSPAAPE